MKLNKTNTPARIEPRTLETTAERRRLSNGSVEWADVKRDVRRGTQRAFDAPLSVQQDEDTFNPYDRRPAEKSKTGRPVKTDLRKLSEWIKALRAIEAKKALRDD